MEKMTLDLTDGAEDANTVKRTAVRGIIKRNGCYLVICSKYGDCKFPGGGQHTGETMADTLVREVREETGYAVKAETMFGYLEVFERCKNKPAGLMEMVSYYYFCDVSEHAGTRNPDAYEAAYGYQAEWLPLEEIIKKNEAVKETETVPWIIRETKVMKQLAEADFLRI